MKNIFKEIIEKEIVAAHYGGDEYTIDGIEDAACSCFILCKETILEFTKWLNSKYLENWDKTNEELLDMFIKEKYNK